MSPAPSTPLRTLSSDSDASAGTIKAPGNVQGDGSDAEDLEQDAEPLASVSPQQTNSDEGAAAESESKPLTAPTSSIPAAPEVVVPPQPSDDPDISPTTEQRHSTTSPTQDRKRIRSSTVHTIDVQEKTTRASRFTLWETKTRFYLIAYNTAQSRFRVLKIDRVPGGQQGPTKPEEHVASGKEKESTSKDVRSVAPSASSKGPEGLPPRSNSSISSTSPGFWELIVTADLAVYDRHQITSLLDMVSEGNRSTGGLREVGHFFGLVGFIRFTSTYYMVLMSRRSVVALLGGHYIYHCDETKIIPVCHPSTMSSVLGRTKAMDQEEARLLHTFKQVDLGKNFYFSYTYDLTRTLQENLTGRGRSQMSQDEGFADKDAQQTAWGYCEKFIWNHHLLVPAFKSTVNTKMHSSGSSASTSDEWIIPLCYGFVDQAKLSIMNRTIHVTLIARRSRHFAGARFLKRGANEAGQVANDVETEQIVSDALTTAFYAPDMCKKTMGKVQEEKTSLPHATKPAQNPRFTSYVMHRGSIPIYWTQDSTNMSPRPPIEISVVDPYYSAAALHFDDMFARYGSPIIILNLIKSKEKAPRETKLLAAFGECISYLNQFLPADKKMPYIAWDMSRASKSQDQDVIGVLEDIAEETVQRTRFFHSGPEPTRFEFQLQGGTGCHSTHGTGDSARRKTILLQTGTVRVNCVDCLDRTNAAQFVIGKAAFGHQLHALGLLEHPSLPFDSDAVDMLTEMYHDLGDTIALQYGGSHLVNTMETYRKINQWTSHSRDMLEGLKRYYSNSFVDADKQAAINLFLGIDKDIVFSPDRLGEAKTVRKANHRRSYQRWFTPAYLEEIKATPRRLSRLQEFIEQERSFFWAEYYRPRLFTDLMRHHAFKMTAVHQRPPHVLTYGTSSVADPASASPKKITMNHDRRSSMASNSSRASVATFDRNRYPSIASLSSVAASSAIYSDASFGRASVYSGASDAPSNSTVDTAILVTSPFISRLPGGGATSARAKARHASGHGHLRKASISSISSSSTVVAPSSSEGTAIGPRDSSTASSGTHAVSHSHSLAQPERKALIGGMRRWMSLNQGGPIAARKGGRLSGRLSAEGAQGGAAKADPPTSDRISLLDQKTVSTSIGGWTNPFAILHVNPSHPHPAQVLLENWENPTVDEEEAREYALWLRQFKGNVQLECHVPEWDARLAQEVATQCFGEGEGRRREMGGATTVGMIPTLGNVASHWHSSDPNLSDADLQMYIQSVRRARLPAATPCAQMDQAAPGTVTNGGSGGGGSIPNAADEAVLKNYAAWGSTTRQIQFASFKNVPEGKLKAYRGWATIGVGGR